MARTHFTEHHMVEPEGRKWNLYRRFKRAEKGPFVAGPFARLCDAMDAAEKAEQERAVRLCSATGALNTCPTCGGERIRRPVCPNDDFHCPEEPFRCPACRKDALARAPQWVAGMVRYENIFACKRCGFTTYIPLAAAERVQEAK